MYDEPTAGLDPVASTVVEDLIRSLHRQQHGAPGFNGGGKPHGGISSYIVVTHQHSTIRRSGVWACGRRAAGRTRGRQCPACWESACPTV